jgi:hypothetical protein
MKSDHPADARPEKSRVESVGHTSARTAPPPICFGHIERTAQCNLSNLLRSDSPKRVRVDVFGAGGTSTELPRVGESPSAARTLIVVSLNKRRKRRWLRINPRRPLFLPVHTGKTPSIHLRFPIEVHCPELAADQPQVPQVHDRGAGRDDEPRTVRREREVVGCEEAPMASNAVSGFLPSASGFHFPNSLHLKWT